MRFGSNNRLDDRCEVMDIRGTFAGKQSDMTKNLVLGVGEIVDAAFRVVRAVGVDLMSSAHGPGRDRSAASP